MVLFKWVLELVINVLGLFDGMSCGQIALERAGHHIGTYYASEIDKFAIKVTQANYPDTIQLGDVTLIHPIKLQRIDLLIGGSPCQGFSFAGKQLAFDDPRSALFFEYVRVLKELKILNPKIKFLLENVRMKKEHLDVISKHLGVEPICINSSLVSAQNRVRYYWTNIEGVVQPEDEGIILNDIIEDGVVDRAKSFCLDANYYKGGNPKQYFEKHRRQLVFSVNDNYRVSGISEKETSYRPHRDDVRKSGISEIGTIAKSNGKASTITLTHSPKLALNNDIADLRYRKLTPIECERLQTVPDNYTDHVSNTQRYKMLGNGWTIDVIAHILKNFKQEVSFF